MKKIFPFIFLSVLSINLFAQLVSEQEINWLSFDELPAKLREERKPILIFIHTDWCKFCLMQQNTTFRNSETVGLLNREYYCLKLDAEQKETIKFLNREYKAQLGAYHQLAEMLGKENGELVFPTTVLLSQNLQLEGRKTSFLNTEVLQAWLKLL